jgi:hypothetical protein
MRLKDRQYKEDKRGNEIEEDRQYKEDKRGNEIEGQTIQRGQKR